MSTSERTAIMDEVHFQIKSLQKIRDHVDVVGDTNVTSSVDNPVLQPVIAPALKESPTPTGDDLETALQIFTLEAVQSLKDELVAITDGNLGLLNKICLDMAAKFGLSFTAHAKETTKTVLSNHQVLIASCQEMIEKSLVPVHKVHEALWRRVSSLELTIQEAIAKSASIEEKVDNLGVVLSSFEEKLDKLIFSSDHQDNALTELELKFECVADSKQAFGKKSGFGKSSPRMVQTPFGAPPLPPVPFPPSAPGPFEYGPPGGSKKTPITMSHTGSPFGGGFGGPVPCDGGLFLGGNHRPPKFPMGTGIGRSHHPFPDSVFLVGMEPSLLEFEFQGQHFKDFLAEMRERHHTESDVELFEMFLLLAQSPPTSTQTILLASNDIAKFKRMATLHVTQLPDSLGDNCKNAARMVEEAKNLAENGFMGVNSILSTNPLDGVLWLLSTVMCALDDLDLRIPIAYRVLMILKALKEKRELSSVEMTYLFDQAFLARLKETEFYLSSVAAYTTFDTTLAEHFSKSMSEFTQFRQLAIVPPHMQDGIQILKLFGLNATSAVILANCVIGVYGQLPRAESLVHSLLQPGEVNMSDYADYLHIWNDVADVLVVVDAIFSAYNDPRSCPVVLDGIRAAAFLEIIRRAKGCKDRLDPLGPRDFVSWKPLLALHADASHIKAIESVMAELDSITQSLEGASPFSSLMDGVPTVQERRKQSQSSKNTRHAPTGGAGGNGGSGSGGKGSQPGQGWANFGNRTNAKNDQSNPDPDVKCSHCRRLGCVEHICCANKGVWSTKVPGRDGILRPGTSCHGCGIFGHRADQCGQPPAQQKVILAIMAKWWADTQPSGSGSRGRKKKSAGQSQLQPAAGGAAQVPVVPPSAPAAPPPSVHPAWLLPPPGVAPAQPPQQAVPLPGTMFVGQPQPSAPARPVKESFKINGKIFQEV